MDRESNEILKKTILGILENARVARKHSFCPTCGNPIVKDEFKDDLSRKEFTISGMCQDCQDKTFVEGGE